jgi:hypothetical protein
MKKLKGKNLQQQAVNCVKMAERRMILKQNKFQRRN